MVSTHEENESIECYTVKVSYGMSSSPWMPLCGDKKRVFFSPFGGELKQNHDDDEHSAAPHAAETTYTESCVLPSTGY